MKVSTPNSSLDINLNRVSSNSRPFSLDKQPSLSKKNSINHIENPIPNKTDNFVMLDGKKLMFNARRGTYLDIIV